MKTRKYSLLRFASFLMLLLLVHMTTFDVFAAQGTPPNGDDKDTVLAGRAFDEFKLPKNRSSECKGKIINIPGDNENILCQKPLPDLPVHIVDVASGKGLDTKTDNDGCYIFKDVPFGTYTESASYNGKEYALEPKIQIQTSQKLFACVSLKEETIDMVLLHEVSNKDRCKCKQFPFLFLLLGGGGAAGILIGTHGGGGEEASPANPQ